MTINDLEQGLRNLVASDPAVLSGNLGEVVRGVMGVAEAYHNYIYRIQSYPVQDVFKFSLMSETAKLENDIAGLACAMLQERGINLLLYINQNTSPYQAGFGGYGNIGQMSFNPQMGASMMGVMPQANGAAPMYSKPNSIMQSMGQPVMNTSRPKPRTTSNYSGYKPTGKPTFATSVKHDEVAGISKEENEENESSNKIERRIEKSSVEVNFNNLNPKDKADEKKNNNSIEEPVHVGPQMFLEEQLETSTEKAAGRDYLLELLKK